MFNLLEQNSQFKKWLCAPDDKSGKLQAEFQLEKASAIGFIDIGKFSVFLAHFHDHFKGFVCIILF